MMERLMEASTNGLVSAALLLIHTGSSAPSVQSHDPPLSQTRRIAAGVPEARLPHAAVLLVAGTQGAPPRSSASRVEQRESGVALCARRAWRLSERGTISRRSAECLTVR